MHITPTDALTRPLYRAYYRHVPIQMILYNTTHGTELDAVIVSTAHAHLHTGFNLLLNH